ncbi:hypothetical protein GCM10011385_14330 [Nitratireductor aestuarii]|uniref:Uncharacterized protein n=1 Tax=Nitratireductor aestuarii TaxID=1735103 RepID=A0A916RMK4_9HYPH|nr:hypothetical protein GCM10011385_14330 [Nitratireductor aestuarii]
MRLLVESEKTPIAGGSTEDELVRLGVIGISWAGVMTSAGVGCAIGSLGGPIAKLAGCGIGMGAGLVAGILGAMGSVVRTNFA